MGRGKGGREGGGRGEGGREKGWRVGWEGCLSKIDLTFFKLYAYRIIYHCSMQILAYQLPRQIRQYVF